MPSASSFASITLPTPGMRATGSGARKASTSCGRITNSPFGLRQSEAILARNLLGATPADAVSCRCLVYFLSYCLRRRGGRGLRRLGFGDIKISLVQRQRFNQVGVAQENFAHAFRCGAVPSEIRSDENRIRAQTRRAQCRHGRANSERACLVRGRAHYRARTAPGDDDGFAAQRRIVALLDRSVKRIHVDVDDLAHLSLPR